MASATRFTVQASFTEPGQCYLCLGIDGPVLNLGKQIPQYGMLVICRSCVEEMFHHFEAPEPVVIREKLDYVQFDAAVDNINSAIANLVSISDTLAIPENEPPTEGNDRGADGATEQDSEPSGKQGTTRVSSDSKSSGLDLSL